MVDACFTASATFMVSVKPRECDLEAEDYGRGSRVTWHCSAHRKRDLTKDTKPEARSIESSSITAF